MKQQSIQAQVWCMTICNGCNVATSAIVGWMSDVMLCVARCVKTARWSRNLIILNWSSSGPIPLSLSIAQASFKFQLGHLEALVWSSLVFYVIIHISWDYHLIRSKHQTAYQYHFIAASSTRRFITQLKSKTVIWFISLLTSFSLRPISIISLIFARSIRHQTIQPKESNQLDILQLLQSFSNVIHSIWPYLALLVILFWFISSFTNVHTKHTKHTEHGTVKGTCSFNHCSMRWNLQWNSILYSRCTRHTNEMDSEEAIHTARESAYRFDSIVLGWCKLTWVTSQEVEIVSKPYIT